MTLNADDRRKIWQVMELMRELKKDTDLEIMTHAKCAEKDLETILAKLNARVRG
jgi:hypothetical protein